VFWLGAIVSLCYVPGITGAFIATQWPALAIMLPFGLLRSGPFTMFHGFGLLFLAYAAVLAYFSVVPYDAVWGLWLLVIMGLSLWFGSTMTDMRHLYAGLAVGGAASSAVAIAQYFGFHGIPITSSAPAGLYVNSVSRARRWRCSWSRWPPNACGSGRYPCCPGSRWRTPAARGWRWPSGCSATMVANGGSS